MQKTTDNEDCLRQTQFSTAKKNLSKILRFSEQTNELNRKNSMNRRSMQNIKLRQTIAIHQKGKKKNRKWKKMRNENKASIVWQRNSSWCNDDSVVGREKSHGFYAYEMNWYICLFLMRCMNSYRKKLPIQKPATERKKNTGCSIDYHYEHQQHKHLISMLQHSSNGICVRIATCARRPQYDHHPQQAKDTRKEQREKNTTFFTFQIQTNRCCIVCQKPALFYLSHKQRS